MFLIVSSVIYGTQLVSKMNGYKRGTVKPELGEATEKMVRDQMKGNLLKINKTSAQLGFIFLWCRRRDSWGRLPPSAIKCQLVHLAGTFLL